MTLTFKDRSLTLFDTRGGYSFSSSVPISGEIASVTDALLAWCESRVLLEEIIGTIVLERGDQIRAAVTVSCPLGERTFVALQEELTEELSAALSATWDALKSQYPES